jgi:hypothetical protein
MPAPRQVPTHMLASTSLLRSRGLPVGTGRSRRLTRHMWEQHVDASHHDEEQRLEPDAGEEEREHHRRERHPAAAAVERRWESRGRASERERERERPSGRPDEDWAAAIEMRRGWDEDGCSQRMQPRSEFCRLRVCLAACCELASARQGHATPKRGDPRWSRPSQPKETNTKYHCVENNYTTSENLLPGSTHLFSAH